LYRQYYRYSFEAGIVYSTVYMSFALN
jgi:hypothetical protein